MRAPFRTWLENKLAEWAVSGKIKSRISESTVVRMLLYSIWFRLAVLGLILFGIGLGLFLLRIWPTSPPGFKPTVKVSGLDLVQAWSLTRNARKAEAQGKMSDAIHAWQAAFANNAADPQSSRGLLASILKCDEPRPYFAISVRQSFWLLRLTSTNQSDVELVSRVYDRFQLQDLTYLMLKPMETNLPPVLEAAFLKSLYETGQIDQFAKHWERAKGRLENDPEMKIYEAAYFLGWGPGNTIPEGRRRLEAAKEDPQWRTLAHRLQLTVSLKLADARTYEVSLQKLTDLRADTPAQQANYWRLLTMNGRKEEATRLAQSYSFPPNSALEVMQLADAYLSIGLRDLARQVYHNYCQDFAYSERLWLKYVSLLLKDELWDDLSDVVLKIRQVSGLDDSLYGFSYYLEGRVAKANNRDLDMKEAFRKLSQFEFRTPELALYIGSELLQLSLPVQVSTLLANNEKSLSQNAGYWELVFAAAYELKDVERLYKAATRNYQLRGQDPVVMNNYAAALLFTRRQPEEAVALTVKLMALEPNSMPAKINHCMALLLNRRTDEAEAMLKGIRPETLSPQEAHSYYLTWFEIYLNRQDWDKARQVSERINPSFMFANQLKWLEEARQKIPASPKSTG